MREIDKALDSLVQAIRTSEEYADYQQMKIRLHEQPDLERRVNEFRKKNFDMQNDSNIDLYEEVDNFEGANRELRSNQLVVEYLSAELAFCRVVQNINWKIIEGLDFEIGFIDEG